MSEKYWKAVRKTETKGVYATGGIGGSSETFFEVGKEYSVEGEPVLCSNGFHFYRERDFCFGVELFGLGKTFYIEIEPLSDIVSDTEKCVCSSIRVLRYIPRKEWRTLIKKNMNSGNMNSGNMNSGNMNSGNMNSGYRNSGDRNSGNRNSGNMNSGDWNSGGMNSGGMNSGDMNSGDMNSGNRNSGYRNSGDRNSGNRNSGNMNSGDWNSGGYNSGNGYRNYFCTETKFFIFDTECTESTIEKVNKIPVWEWFSVICKSYYEAWSECPDEHLQMFADIKEFQTDEARKKFKEITGRDLP